MAKLSIYDIKEEIVVALRNADILTVGTRGVTTSQDTGSFSADSTHTLGTNPTLVKNVRNVNVDSTDLTLGTDYTVNYNTGVISFTSPQTGAYVIDYDQGSTDRIFPDFPQGQIKRSTFPRISVDYAGSGAGQETLYGTSSSWTDHTLEVRCYDLSQKNVDTMVSDVRTFIMDNKKVWYYPNYVILSRMSGMIVIDWGEQKIFERNQAIRIPLLHES